MRSRFSGGAVGAPVFRPVTGVPMISRALAPAPKHAPQQVRTFFVSTKTWGGRSILQTERVAELLLDVLRVNRERGRFELHEFVIMRDHLHLVLTLAEDESLEKCVQ